MIDFISLCKDQRLPFLVSGHHHCGDGWIQTHCPFCGDGSHGWHLGFSTEYGNMSCWRCGKHSLLDWLRRMLPAGSGSQIGKIIYSHETGRRNIVKKKKVIRKRNAKSPPGLESLQQSHRNFLLKRNFDPVSLVLNWGLKGTGHLSLQWNFRIVAPISNKKKEIVAYTGRTLADDVKPKWLTSSDEETKGDPRTLIYGIEYTETDKGILIVEGPSDVWRMGRGCVSLMGTSWHIKQAAILRNYKRRFIYFDPEDNAQIKAAELAHWLSVFPGETEIITDMKTDPGDLPQQEANYIMKELGIRNR
jgi:hypothetical protein